MEFETLASLITSFIMCIIGIEVIRNASHTIMNPNPELPSLITAIVGFISGIMMYGVYRFNHSLAKK